MRFRDVEKLVKQLSSGGGGGFSPGAPVDRTADLLALAAVGAPPNGYLFTPADPTRWTQVSFKAQLFSAPNYSAMVRLVATTGDPDWLDRIDGGVLEHSCGATNDPADIAGSITALVPPGLSYYLSFNGVGAAMADSWDRNPWGIDGMGVNPLDPAGSLVETPL